MWINGIEAGKLLGFRELQIRQGSSKSRLWKMAKSIFGKCNLCNMIVALLLPLAWINNLQIFKFNKWHILSSLCNSIHQWGVCLPFSSCIPCPAFVNSGRGDWMVRKAHRTELLRLRGVYTSPGKCRFWFSKSGLGPENFHLSLALKWCQSCWTRSPREGARAGVEL